MRLKVSDRPHTHRKHVLVSFSLLSCFKGGGCGAMGSKQIYQTRHRMVDSRCHIRRQVQYRKTSIYCHIPTWHHRVFVLLNSREVLSCFKHDDNKEIWRPAPRGSMIRFNICHTFSLFYNDIDRKLSFLGSSALERLLGSFFNYIIVCTNFWEFFHKETEKPK